jgi:hypothetical protein
MIAEQPSFSFLEFASSVDFDFGRRFLEVFLWSILIAVVAIPLFVFVATLPFLFSLAIAPLVNNLP